MFVAIFMGSTSLFCCEYCFGKIIAHFQIKSCRFVCNNDCKLTDVCSNCINLQIFSYVVEHLVKFVAKCKKCLQKSFQDVACRKIM